MEDVLDSHEMTFYVLKSLETTSHWSLGLLYSPTLASRGGLTQLEVLLGLKIPSMIPVAYTLRLASFGALNSKQ